MASKSSSKISTLFWSVAVAQTLMACSSSQFDSSTATKKAAPEVTGSDKRTKSAEELPKTLAPDGGGSDGFFAQGPIKSPRFALLVNDLKCGMCHTRVNGDVASTSDVSDWSSGHIALSNESVSGNWYAAKSWTDVTPSGSRYLITIGGKVERNYVGNQVPNDPVSGKPAFPQIDFVGAELRMGGTLTGMDASGKPVTISKVHTGNAVVIGTKDAPIVIDGSVMIKGDLVIKGVYKGLGSIYSTGTIYIPANLVAAESVFPMPKNPEDAKKKGAELVAAKTGNALGIATSKSILIADLDSGIYDNQLTPAPQKRAALGVDDVYDWFPGGKTAYKALYENAVDCDTGKLISVNGFNLIEAYLYAGVSIGGRARRSSWAINGGVITDVFHVLGGVSPVNDRTPGCPSTPSPVHGMPQDGNYVNYDYRMQAGLRILGELAPYFN